MATESTKEVLEIIVRREGMATVLLTLSEVAQENAESVRWQNKAKAAGWERCARALRRCMRNPAIALAADAK